MLLETLLLVPVRLLRFALPFVSSCFDSELGRETIRKARKKTGSSENKDYVEAGNAHVLSKFDSLCDQLSQDPSVPYDLSIYEPFIQDLTASRSNRTGVPYVAEKDVAVNETQSPTESDSPLNTYAAASSESRPRAPEVLQHQNKDGYFETGNAHVLSRFDSLCDQLFEDPSVPYDLSIYEPFIQYLTASRSHRTGVPYDLSIYEPFIQVLTASRSHGVPYRVEKDVTVKETQILTESDSPPNTYAAASSESRPKATEVQQPPIMSWSSKEISLFLCATSEILKQRRKKTGRILTALERTSKTVFGDGCDRWDEKMDPEFIRVICRRGRRRGGRCYNFKSVRALVDAFRNNKTHYLLLPKNIKNLVGPDLYAYFYRKFPELFPEVYKVMLEFCSNEDWFKEYPTSCI